MLSHELGHTGANRKVDEIQRLLSNGEPERGKRRVREQPHLLSFRFSCRAMGLGYFWAFMVNENRSTHPSAFLVPLWHWYTLSGASIDDFVPCTEESCVWLSDWTIRHSVTVTARLGLAVSPARDGRDSMPSPAFERSVQILGETIQVIYLPLLIAVII